MKNGIFFVLLLCVIELSVTSPSNAETSLISKPKPYFYLKGVGACNGGGPPTPEICDGIDNDCDGDTDEMALDAIEWCRDFDMDTFGDLQNSIMQCDQPFGYVMNCEDCNDMDDMVLGGCGRMIFINNFESNPP